MHIRDATREFERWLGGQTPLIQSDLRHKHAAMREDLFSFFRATYYRWAQRFPVLCPEVAMAPQLLCIGDIHIENYGTWRDELGRLAWGVNDFDEAYILPITHDLVRLATSVLIILASGHLSFKGKAGCRAILEGYREGLTEKGRPFVIGDAHRWFQPLLRTPERDPGAFWDHLHRLKRYVGNVPPNARSAIVSLLPKAKLAYTIRHRVAGLGNLGKPRLTALAAWCGGPLAIDAKAITLSAAAWAAKKTDGPYCGQILKGPVRSPDPFFRVFDGWLVRRLAPDCRRIELDALSRVKDQEYLLHAMGVELANVHLGVKAHGKALLRFVDGRKSGWLRSAAERMCDATVDDWKQWRKT